jgi:restriction endonuclease-like protein
MQEGANSCRWGEVLTTYANYVQRLVSGFWDYAENSLGVRRAELLETIERSGSRPPVFARDLVEHNLLYPPEASPAIRRQILSSLPASERHRYFGSMRSSQALAQSVFGSLAALGKTHVLANIPAEGGLPAFGGGGANSSVELEVSVQHLGEPRPTSVDVWLNGTQRVAVECKLTEPEFGTCSRPSLREGRDRNYERDHCDGTYTQQRGRSSRCTLTEIGVRYWEYVPELFRWPGDSDLKPCPLRGTYQLGRNVLAACVGPDGSVDVDSHALVIYDERNPSFRSGGESDKQWEAATGALLRPESLRRCSWQTLATHLADDPELRWLTDGLFVKYGISAEGEK